MLAGIFGTKKRAARFATLRANKRRRAGRREPDRSGFAQLTERRRQSQLRPRPWMDRTTSGDSKQGGRSTQSPCRTIPQTVTDWPEEPWPAMLPLPVTPCRCSPRLPCDDGGDDDGSGSAMRPGPPCWPQPQVLPCSAQPLVLPQGPVRKPASPSRWRRKLRRGLIGCASYSWISLIWAALNGSQMTIKRIAIPVPSGSRQDLHTRLGQFPSALTSR
jgi:hypothetical protein